MQNRTFFNPGTRSEITGKKKENQKRQMLSFHNNNGAFFPCKTND
jgi:hypothetical protein